MKNFRLVRIECYRFWHSMDLIKYLLLVAPMLFIIGYFSSRSYIEIVGKEKWAQEIWNASLSNLFNVILLIGVISAAYIGREYRTKTIHYELMQGYPIEVIALSKMVTCGVLSAFIVLGSMLLVNGCVPGALSAAGIFRILLLYLFYFHLFSVSTLWVMIFRNGLAGGIAIFFRFLCLDGIIVQFFEGAKDRIGGVLFLSRWEKLLDVATPVSGYEGLTMIVATLMEIILLLAVLRFLRNRVNY